MEKRLICIGCPLGCEIKVKMSQNQISEITGNTCPRGEAYARKEIEAPGRIVTTTVRVKNGNLPVVSVKTESDIPKEKVMDCIRELSNIIVKAPVKIGEIVLANGAGTGVDIVATRNVKTTNPQ